jgi:hypothetical protein
MAIGAIVAAPAAGASTAATATAQGPWSVDWAAGITFGTIGNVGPHAVADCAIATVADIEQVIKHKATPPDPAPYLAVYRSLARAEGEAPSSDAGLVPSAVLTRWRTTGIAGSRISSAAPITSTPARIEAALASGPVYAVIDLPASASNAPTWVNSAGVALTAWSAATPPSGYAGGGAHVVAVVGYNASAVLVATWGYVQPISWGEWAALATGAWQVTP